MHLSILVDFQTGSCFPDTAKDATIYQSEKWIRFLGVIDEVELSMRWYLMCRQQHFLWCILKLVNLSNRVKSALSSSLQKPQTKHTPCCVFRSEVPVIPPDISAAAPRDAKSYGFCCAFTNLSHEHERFWVWKAVLITAHRTECTPSLLLRHSNKNLRASDSCRWRTVLGAAVCCLLAEQR